jgi:3-methylcrotonyl-CoA carboxylase alpha subunit
MFERILVANRGEIAVRVMRTARRLGIGTVAVYSDADRDARHRVQADAAVHLPGNLPRETYLDIPRIIAAARDSGAQAIHPGYGFLSENAAFARACAEAGLVFIGPPPSAIEAMGSKSAAKRLMAEAGVPLVPGYHGAAQDDATLAGEAERIGWPVLIKAVAGGGGKGMRAVQAAAEFPAALAAARREAMSAFGDDAVLLEKYLTRPRHVEVQVFCDTQGNAVHLFERDCSIQRRHQKVVEEAPAPGVDAALRARMGEVAVKAARAIGYVGAGTIEFLLEGDQFWFMEMNTRLQVEHPVTEFITGQDLVEWQLRVAAGQPLPLRQEQLRIDGHAIEVRLCAEDPDHDFRPASGRLHVWDSPAGDAAVRLDSGVAAGDAVAPFYDPMLAKLICHGRDRQEAAARLAQALRELRIAGIATNRSWLHRVVGSAPFLAADLDTRFIERHAALLTPSGDTGLAAALVAACEVQSRESASGARHAADPYSPWDASDGWEPTGARRHPVALLAGDTTLRLTVQADGSETRVQHDGHEQRLALDVREQQGALRVDWRRDAQQGTAFLHAVGDDRHLFLGGEQFRYTLPALAAEPEDAQDSSARAPMNGRIVTLLAEPGSKVAAGAPLLVMEAMKMEHTLCAPCDGEVTAFRCAPGDIVDEGAQLFDFVAGGTAENAAVGAEVPA